MLIGLNGRKGAGKDTVYERVATHLSGYAPVERRAFADPVYELAARALDITVEDLRRTKDIPHRRRFLQRIGDGARQVFGESFWVDQVDLSHEGRIVLVTDVRYENEALAITDAGGHVYRVLGPPRVEKADDPHVTERPLPAWLLDGVIDNSDHSLGKLDARVLDVVLELLRQERLVRG